VDRVTNVSGAHLKRDGIDKAREFPDTGLLGTLI
jgi:hypothetical protein